MICDVLIRESRDAEMAAMLSQKLNVEEMETLRQQEEQDMLYARNLMVSVFLKSVKICMHNVLRPFFLYLTKILGLYHLLMIFFK